ARALSFMGSLSIGVEQSVIGFPRSSLYPPQLPRGTDVSRVQFPISFSAVSVTAVWCCAESSAAVNIMINDTTTLVIVRVIFLLIFRAYSSGLPLGDSTAAAKPDF